MSLFVCAAGRGSERSGDAGGSSVVTHQIISLALVVLWALTVNNTECMEQFSDSNGAQVNDLSRLLNSDLKQQCFEY